MDRNDLLRKIANLKAELGPVLASYKSLTDAAVDAAGKPRAFTAEEFSNHEKIAGEINALNSQLATAQNALKSLTLVEEDDARTASELRLSDRHKPLQATDEYFDAFQDWASTGFDPKSLEIDRDRFKALTTVSPSTGGVLIPTVIEKGIMMEALSLSPLLSLSRVSFTKSTSSQQPFGSRLGLLGPRKEAEAYVLVDPTITQKQIDIYNFGAIMAVSQELFDDAEGLSQYFTEVFGEAYAETIEEYGWKGTAGTTGFTNQAGSGVTITLAGRVPPGIRSENSTAVPVVTAGHATNVAWTDVMKLKQAVHPAYRSSGSFVISSDFESKVLLLAGTDGRPLWQPNIAIGTPATLFGSPYYVSDRLANATTGLNPAFYGDFKRGHEIRIRKGLTVKRSDHFFFGNGMIALAADVRWGAKVKLNAAIARLNMA